MSAFTINAQIRSDKGKGASRRLRRISGQIPAILYGAEEAPQSLALSQRQVNKHLESEAFLASVIEVDIEGKSTAAILKDMQRHPSRGDVLHVDLLRVADDRPIKVTVPIHFTNERKSEAIKAGGKATHILNQVKISCLPKDLPEFLEVNMHHAKVGEIIHLSDIPCPEGVTIPALELGPDHDQPVATLAAKRK